jgi:hypothetical protein
MSQASIASFFMKKPAAQAAQGTGAGEGAKASAAKEVEGECTPDSTPAPQKDERMNEGASGAPTPHARKRLRQVESSDSEDDKPAAPTRSAGAEEAAPGAQACTGPRESVSPEKKQRPQATPEKKKESADSASVKHFFAKQQPAEHTSHATNSKAPPAGSGKPAAGGKDTEMAESTKEDKETEAAESAKEDKAAAASKPLSNMEKRKAEDKRQREEALKNKSQAKIELGGGWGGSAVVSKSEDAGKDAASDEEDPLDEVDEDTSQELLKTASSFDASKEATWKKGEPVPYSHLANMFGKVEEITKRLEITAIVTKALRAVIETTPEDLLPVIYLCVNKMASAHEGIELGLGDMVLKKALAEATGRQAKDITADYQKLGDLGKVANKSRGLQTVMFKAKALTVQGVHKSMLQIAKMTGAKSGDQKKDKIKSLLVAAQGMEAQYVVRQLQGKMRNGLGEQTVLVALAHAVAQSKGARTKEALDKAVEILKEVFCQLPCYDRVIPELLANPISDLPTKCFLQPGIPVKPMLAHPTKGISEVLDRFEGKTFTCEYKYDGERAQVSMSETHSVIDLCVLWARPAYVG